VTEKTEFDDLTPEEWLALDYDRKLKLLDLVTGRIFSLRLKMAPLSGQLAELKAEFTVLKETKSALQSSIKAEGG